MKKPISLRSVLFVSFTLVSLIPIFFLSFGVHKAAFNLELNAVEDKHLIIAKNLTGSIERYLTDIKSALNAFAKNVSNNQRPTAEIVDLMYDLNFRNIWKLERNGQSYPLIHNKVFAGDDPLPEEAKSQIFQSAPANRNKFTVTGIINDVHGEPVFFVAKLIDIDSVLVGAVGVDYIRQVQENISFGKRGHAAIVDQFGHVIAHPYREWVKTSKDISFLPPVQKMKAGITGVSQFYTPAMGEDMIAGHTVVDSVGWGVMIPQPISELEHITQYAIYIALLVALFGTLIASAISWWLASFITRPIKNMVAFTDMVAKSDIEVTIPDEKYFSPLETHKLTNAFNQMIDRLNTKRTELLVSTQRLRHAQNIARLGNWELNLETNRMWWSDEVYRILGIKKNEKPNPILEDFTRWMSSKDKEDFLQKLSIASLQKKPFSIDQTILIDNGQHIYVHQDIIVQQRTNSDGMCVTGTIQDISERKKYENKLFFQAHYDVLTKMANRQLCLQKLKTEIGQAESRDRLVALLVIGLDHFKEVNESLGHIAGDEILVLAAHRIQTSVGKNSLVARLGSDEFAVVLSNISDKQNIIEATENIIAAFNKPFIVNDIETIVGSSIGYSIYPKDGSDPLTLLQKADTALHELKSGGGRGTYKEFCSNMNEQVLQRMNLRSDLALAIENRELSLAYQPIVESMTGKVIAAEALLRWNHPTRGMVPPEKFIALAEKTGYIRDIGFWALDQACSQLRTWRDKGFDSIRMSINLSPSQIQYGLNKDTILSILNKHRLQPSDLCLEVTESIIMDDMETCLKWMNELVDAGIHFSIDDFGTGYSSLSYLVKMPVSSIKIDGTFVSSMLYGERDAALIESIITLSKKLKFKVIAEGVETIEQRKQLIRYGCDNLQGHFFSKPLHANEFAKYIELNSVKRSLLERLEIPSTQL